MKNTLNQIPEDIVLKSSALFTMKEISMVFTLRKRYGDIYFLTDNFYTESTIYKSKPFSRKFDARLFPEGIEKFIEEKITDNNCLGLVPLTTKSKNSLTDKYNLRLVAFSNQKIKDKPLELLIYR